MSGKRVFELTEEQLNNLLNQRAAAINHQAGPAGNERDGGYIAGMEFVLDTFGIEYKEVGGNNVSQV